MRHGSRGPRRASDLNTAWCPWGATSTCLEGTCIVNQGAQLTRFAAPTRAGQVRQVATRTAHHPCPGLVSHSGAADEHIHIERQMPAEDSIVMSNEADTRVCMLDRADYSNELFRFSTTEQKWETLIEGSPPSGRWGHGMVSVGSDLYVFGGRTRQEPQISSGLNPNLFSLRLNLLSRPKPCSLRLTSCHGNPQQVIESLPVQTPTPKSCTLHRKAKPRNTAHLAGDHRTSSNLKPSYTLDA
jgi:hypothetical protein